MLLDNIKIGDTITLTNNNSFKVLSVDTKSDIFIIKLDGKIYNEIEQDYLPYAVFDSEGRGIENLGIKNILLNVNVPSSSKKEVKGEEPYIKFFVKKELERFKEPEIHQRYRIRHLKKVFRKIPDGDYFVETNSVFYSLEDFCFVLCNEYDYNFCKMVKKDEHKLFSFNIEQAKSITSKGELLEYIIDNFDEGDAVGDIKFRQGYMAMEYVLDNKIFLSKEEAEQYLESHRDSFKRSAYVVVEDFINDNTYDFHNHFIAYLGIEKEGK
jgi:hypothetical protein